ncbi:hypothetical protein PFISCL1PPCAC_7362, partial [Pristionchus fissidentatus]
DQRTNLQFGDFWAVSVHVGGRTRCRCARSTGDASRRAERVQRVDIRQFDEHARDHYSIGFFRNYSVTISNCKTKMGVPYQ